MKCITFLMVFIPLVSSGQNMERVLNDYFTAIGGLDNWRKINSIRQTAESYFYTGNASDSTIKPSTSTSTYKMPNFAVTTSRTPDGGKSIFYQNDKKSGILSHGRFSELSNIYQYFVFEMTINIRDLLEANKFKYVKEIEEGGRKYDILQATVEPFSKDKADYYFDQSTHLLSSVHSFTQGIKRVTIYTDYRTVNGNLKAPFDHVLYNDDRKFYRSVRKELELNPTINDSIFYYFPKDK